jgi:hypothetical protein
MLWDFGRALRRSGERWVLHGAIAVMLAVLSAGWYEFNLGDGEILTLFMAAMGCGYVAVERLVPNPDSSPRFRGMADGE